MLPRSSRKRSGHEVRTRHEAKIAVAAGGELASEEDFGEECGRDDGQQDREGEIDGEAQVPEVEQTVVEHGGWRGIGESLRAGEEAQLMKVGKDAVVMCEIGEAIIPVHPHAAVFVATDSPDQNGDDPGDGA